MLLSVVGLMCFNGVLEVPAETKEFSLSVKKTQSRYVVDVWVTEFSREDFFTAINDGMRSQITYILRLYREIEGFFSFFGDALIWEEKITYEAGWDNFTNTYFINFPWGERREYKNSRNLAEDFFRLEAYSIRADLLEGGSFYLAGRAEFIQVKLVPPMNIISFFLRGNRQVTDWIRIDIRK